MVQDEKYVRHARLVSVMADRVGLDLVEELERGRIESEGLRQMVHRCQNCSDPEACEKLLAQSQPMDNPPSYCRNAHIFEAHKA